MRANAVSSACKAKNTVVEEHPSVTPTAVAWRRKGQAASRCTRKPQMLFSRSELNSAKVRLLNSSGGKQQIPLRPAARMEIVLPWQWLSRYNATPCLQLDDDWIQWMAHAASYPHNLSVLA
jgi:hypothetical protein